MKNVEKLNELQKTSIVNFATCTYQVDTVEATKEIEKLRRRKVELEERLNEQKKEIEKAEVWLTWLNAACK